VLLPPGELWEAGPKSPKEIARAHWVGLASDKELPYDLLVFTRDVARSFVRNVEKVLGQRRDVSERLTCRVEPASVSQVPESSHLP
jgi:hypothetical protein